MKEIKRFWVLRNTLSGAYITDSQLPNYDIETADRYNNLVEVKIELDHLEDPSKWEIECVVLGII